MEIIEKSFLRQKKKPALSEKEEVCKAGIDYFAKIEKNAGMYRYTVEHFEPEARKEYMEEGAEFLIDAREKGVETIVFMDRSARPLAGFFRALWKRLWPDERPPEMKFMVASQEGVGYTAKDVARVFAPAKSAFENKIVLLVDEAVVSGGTLSRAKKMLGEAFPQISEILLGGMLENREKNNASLDIRSPYGSGAYSIDGNMLGKNLCGQTEEVAKEVGFRIGEAAGEAKFMPEIPVKVHTKASRGQWLKSTHSYLLWRVGKHETLDEHSLKAIDKKIAEEKDIDKKSRLLKIREAYEKLMK